MSLSVGIGVWLTHILSEGSFQRQWRAYSDLVLASCGHSTFEIKCRYAE